MDPDFGLRVGVMLGAGGLWMLQNRSGSQPSEGAPDGEMDELHRRLALLERIATDSAGAHGAHGLTPR